MPTNMESKENKGIRKGINLFFSRYLVPCIWIAIFSQLLLNYLTYPKQLLPINIIRVYDFVVLLVLACIVAFEGNLNLTRIRIFLVVAIFVYSIILSILVPIYVSKMDLSEAWTIIGTMIVCTIIMFINHWRHGYFRFSERE